MSNVEKFKDIIDKFDSFTDKISALMQILYKNNCRLEDAYILYLYLNKDNNRLTQNLEENVKIKNKYEEVLSAINNDENLKNEIESISKKLKFININIDLANELKNNGENVGVCSHCDGTQKTWNEGYYEDRGYYSKCYYCTDGYRINSDFISLKSILEFINKFKNIECYNVGDTIKYNYEYGDKNKQSKIKQIKFDTYEGHPYFILENGDSVKITKVFKDL